MSAAPNLLAADPAAIRAFLSDVIAGDIQLVSIVPDGPTSGRWFGDDAGGATAWATAENMRGRGVYFTPNVCRPGVHKKPEKDDILAQRFLHLDLDPPKDGRAWSLEDTHARLTGLRYPPSLVIASGGGLGAFWRLDDVVCSRDTVEAANRGLCDALDADRCWNVDRVMRLPGTINWPNRKKIAAGRQPRLAAVLQDDDGVVYPLHALASAFPERKPERDRGDGPAVGPFALITAGDLKLSTLHPLRSLIENPAGRDRSTDALACAGRMARDGYSDEQIMGVLLNPANAVSAHLLDQRDPRYQALRCIERVRGDQGSASDDATPISDAAPDLLPLIDPSLWSGQDVPPREWALEDWIPARQATYLTGPGSAGKSLVSQLLCTCIAIGLPFMGIETRAATAIYLTCEDDADELHRRQKAFCDGLGVPLAGLTGKLHLVSLAGAIGSELATFTPEGKMATTAAWQRLRATVLAIDAGFIVLDNVAHLFAGNENIRNQVAAFVGLLNSLAQEAGASVLFLGHPNKAGDAFSGSTAWENQVRSRLFLTTPKDEDGAILDPDVRELSRGKANYARNGEAVTFRWHAGTFMREADMAPNVGAEIAAVVQANAENAAFLKCLARATTDRRAVSHVNGSNYAPRVFAKMIEAGGMKPQAFERAMERLLYLATIRLDRPLWKADNRHWKYGIRLASDGDAEGSESAPTPAPTPALTPCVDPRQPPAQVIDNAASTLRAPTPLDTTYQTGAAHQAPAPLKEEVRGLGTPVFTAGGGWERRAPILAPNEGPDDGLEHWP